MQIIRIYIETPGQVNFSEFGNNLVNDFFMPIYGHLYDRLEGTTTVYPHIDSDHIAQFIRPLIQGLTPEQLAELRSPRVSSLGLSLADISIKDGFEKKALMIFLFHFPKFSLMLKNMHLLSQVAILAAEVLLAAPIDANNFINAKRELDQINRVRWNRRQNRSEEQSGNSNLGTLSETLLEKALATLLDGKNFFKNNNQEVQSYGDFVLMALPNNLWLSVKSNFARERLLASGYTTDIIGVGFFESMEEFTSRSKIRNFQRVGFLAMYLPDLPVSEEQVQENTNTYRQVMDFYSQPGRVEPMNVNGTPFIRSLSDLREDLTSLIGVAEISKRTTLRL